MTSIVGRKVSEKSTNTIKNRRVRFLVATLLWIVPAFLLLWFSKPVRAQSTVKFSEDEDTENEETQNSKKSNVETEISEDNPNVVIRSRPVDSEGQLLALIAGAEDARAEEGAESQN